MLRPASYILCSDIRIQAIRTNSCMHTSVIAELEVLLSDSVCCSSLTLSTGRNEDVRRVPVSRGKLGGRAVIVSHFYSGNHSNT